MSTDNDQNAHLLRKLQNKLRKQRHDLQRAHEYDLKQKLQSQSDEYKNEIQSIQSELSTQKETHQRELKSLKEELQSTHHKEIDEYEKKIANIQHEYQTQYDDLKQTNNELKTQIQQIKNENNQLKSQSDKLIKQKDIIIQKNKDEINNMKDEAKQIQNEVLQWISNRQSNPITSPSNFHFNEIETKLCELDKNAKHFIECRLNIWNESNEESDAILIELDDKQQTIIDLNNQLEYVSNQLEFKTTELQRIENNYQDDLIRDINEYKIEMQHVEKLLASEIENKQTVETELTNVIKSNKDLMSRITEIEKQNNEFDVKTKHKQEIICEMKHKLDKCDNNLQQNQKCIMSLQMELEKTILNKNDILRQLSDKSDELIEYKTKLAMSNSSHRKQMCSLESELQNSLNELRDKTRQCQKLNQRVANISDHVKVKVKRKKKNKCKLYNDTNVKF
eukprot:423005_1